jgi:hypothetical protein
MNGPFPTVGEICALCQGSGTGLAERVKQAVTDLRGAGTTLFGSGR